VIPMQGLPIIRTLRAGEGFQAQNSKWLHFGLGSADQISRVTVAWPGGETESFSDLQVDHRYRLVCGEASAKRGRARSIQWPSPLPKYEAQKFDGGQANTPSRLPVPELPYLKLDGKRTRVSLRFNKRLTLVNLWASWCPPCVKELKEFAAEKTRLEEAGLDVVALSLDGVGQHAGDVKAAEAFMSKLGDPFATGIATPELLEKISILHDQIYEKRGAVALPTSLLIDESGRLAGYYEGSMDLETLMERVEIAKASDPLAAMTKSLPFSGRWLARPLGFLLTEYGNALLKQDLLEDAVSLWRGSTREFELDPNAAAFAAKLGVAIEKQGRLDEAIKFYEQATQLKPNNAQARVSLAAKYMRVNRAGAAISTYQAALKIDPALVDARYNLAILLSRTQRPAEALAEFRRVLKDKPSHTLAHANIAAAMMNKQDFKAAIEHLRLALKSKPDFTAVRLQLAKLLEATNQKKDAIQQYEQLLKQQPNFAPAVEGLRKLKAQPAAGR